MATKEFNGANQYDNGNTVVVQLGEPKLHGSNSYEFIKKLLGLREFITLDTYRSCLAEFFGTAYLTFLFFSCLAGIEYDKLWYQGGAVTAVFCGICMVCGMIWIIFHLSGSNMNPALSISFAINGLISCTRAFLYIPCQLVGAIVGSAIHKALTPEGYTGAIVCTKKSDLITVTQAYFYELIGTALLAIVYLSCVDLRLRHPEKGISGQFGQGPLMAAIVAGGIFFGIVPWSGGSINPARSFGPAVIFGHWDYHWIYWVGPIPGAILGAAFYKYCLHQKWEIKSCRDRRPPRTTLDPRMTNDEDVPMEDTCCAQWFFWRHHHIDE
jgi:glycerol uptake facilitator-like aquaporin